MQKHFTPIIIADFNEMAVVVKTECGTAKKPGDKAKVVNAMTWKRRKEKRYRHFKSQLEVREGIRETSQYRRKGSKRVFRDGGSPCAMSPVVSSLCPFTFVSKCSSIRGWRRWSRKSFGRCANTEWISSRYSHVFRRVKVDRSFAVGMRVLSKT